MLLIHKQTVNQINVIRYSFVLLLLGFLWRKWKIYTVEDFLQFCPCSVVTGAVLAKFWVTTQNFDGDRVVGHVGVSVTIEIQL